MPCVWYEKIDSWLEGQNFIKSTANYNMYIIYDQSNKILILLLYINNLLFPSNHLL